MCCMWSDVFSLDVTEVKEVFKEVDWNIKVRLTSDLGSTARRDRTDRESRNMCTDGKYRVE